MSLNSETSASQLREAHLQPLLPVTTDMPNWDQNKTYFAVTINA